MKQIIVLGGGYGGVLTAKKLAKQLKKQRDVRITLIDKKPYHTLLTELHEVAANRVHEDSIKIELKKIFAGFKNVDVVLDEIRSIDFNANKVVSDNQTYHYDYLVIGTGSKPTFFGIPGADRYALTLWSYEDAVRIREHVADMFRQAVKEGNPQIRKEMLTFAVVGAGFTGVEMVGELAEYTEQLCKEFYVDPAEVKVHVLDMAPKILPILPDPLIKKSEQYLLKLGVHTTVGSMITGVKENGVILGDREIDSRTVIWSAGVEGSDLIDNVDVHKNGRKRIVTNDKLQTLEFSNVYVVVDNIFYIPEGSAAPVPQMVENAEHAAPLIAYNIVADLRQQPKKSYKPVFHGTMVCIGSRWGVANVGTPKKMYLLSGFPAMLIKHLINMLYLFQVCGFNKVWSYMMHEFFHVKHNHSFLGGHFAKRSPNFWLVPLRLFVGFMWMKEGFEKLAKIIADPGKIFLIPPPTDGTSGASLAEGAEGAIQALPVPDFIQAIVRGSMDLLFYNNDGGYTALAALFQAGMVLAEIVLGGLLMIGLFTAVSSAATLAMGIMVWSSGMASYDMLWFLAGGIALIGGSGSTFGLDYYVLPRLKRIWKKLPFVKRWYLFTD